MAEKKMVWLLVYSHRHGEDRSAYETEQGVLKAVKAIIRESIADIENAEFKAEIKKGIEDALQAEDFPFAFELWNDYQSMGQETLEWEETELIPD